MSTEIDSCRCWRGRIVLMPIETGSKADWCWCRRRQISCVTPTETECCQYRRDWLVLLPKEILVRTFILSVGADGDWLLALYWQVLNNVNTDGGLSNINQCRRRLSICVNVGGIDLWSCRWTGSMTGWCWCQQRLIISVYRRRLTIVNIPTGLISVGGTNGDWLEDLDLLWLVLLPRETDYRIKHAK